MHLFQILLPRADNTGRPFDREDFDRVKEELAPISRASPPICRRRRRGLWRKAIRPTMTTSSSSR